MKRDISAKLEIYKEQEKQMKKKNNAKERAFFSSFFNFEEGSKSNTFNKIDEKTSGSPLYKKRGDEEEKLKYIYTIVISILPISKTFLS